MKEGMGGRRIEFEIDTNLTPICCVSTLKRKWLKMSNTLQHSVHTNSL